MKLVFALLQAGYLTTSRPLSSVQARPMARCLAKWPLSIRPQLLPKRLREALGSQPTNKKPQPMRIAPTGVLTFSSATK